MEDEQFQYFSGIMMSSKGFVKKQPPVPPPMTSKVQMDEDAAIMESKISQVKDLFPNYGKGFLAACLEVYNHNPEEVIQRILENTLHEDLQSLDTSLETMPAPKSTMTFSRNDKGKGKLVEPASPAIPINAVTEQQIRSPSVTSSSTVGRFIRKSKAELPDHVTLDTRDGKDIERTNALISQYEYEDEYDDSFDDLGQSIVESGFEENEMLGDRMRSNLGNSWGTETENSTQKATSSKWGSKKKPQYYVKDGKNYSYKVAGAVAVANADEASIVTQAQEELIYGLGRGGNRPLGAVKKLMEHQEQQQQSNVHEVEGRGNMKNSSSGFRGGRRGGRTRDSHVEQDDQSDSTEMGGRGNAGNYRGRGRRGGRNHYRKDRAAGKHFSGLTGL